ncbi:MAG: hypothetical protein ABIO82_05405, partial [Ginsengibacter sp.]
MKKFLTVSFFIIISFVASRCNQEQSAKTDITKDSIQVTTSAPTYGGFDNQVDWGKHIVAIGGCNDCHTPKKMGPAGPEDNMDLLLSGHPAQVPVPDINRKEIESKGLAV